MQHTTRKFRQALSGGLLAFMVLAAPAQGHVRLVSPAARYPIPDREDSSNLKNGPCGVTGDARTTDPSRVTTFTPGETITVEFIETINHPGHFRIAFDDDGQDDFQEPASFTDIQATPTLPVLLDGIEDQDGGTYTVQVTLPDIECSNCTLQLIQVMTERPPYGDGNDLYFQCADIVLAAPAGSGGAGGGGTLQGGMPATGGEPFDAGGMLEGLETGGLFAASGGDLVTGGSMPSGGVLPTGGVSLTGGAALGGGLAAGGSSPAGGMGEGAGGTQVGSGGLAATGGASVPTGGASVPTGGASVATGGVLDVASGSPATLAEPSTANDEPSCSCRIGSRPFAASRLWLLGAGALALAMQRRRRAKSQ